MRQTNSIAQRTLAWAMLLLIGSAGAGASTRPSTYEPTSHYVIRRIEGWPVYVHRMLLDEKKELGERAMRRLAGSLENIVRVIPPAATAKLKQVPIWLEYDNPKNRLACFHPSRQWLINNGFNPEKAGCVELGGAERFLDPRKVEHQPWMILHELAHAYHFRVLGGDHKEIKAAYARARDAGLYSSILIWNGRKGRHYALTNDKEFFAELTESYFGVNDFYPFVRAEFREYDPESCRLIERLWGIETATTRPTTRRGVAVGADYGGGVACESGCD